MLRSRRASNSTSQEAIPFQVCPAKTFIAPTGEVREGRGILNHCQIVGHVAQELLNRLPQAIRHELFPDNAAFAAAAHDIGKVSPCFFEKIRQACTPGSSQLPPLPNINPALEKEWGGHAGVSQVTANALDAPDWVPAILGQHHGFSPDVKLYRANDEIFGGPLWQRERELLVAELKNALNMDWPVLASVAQARVLAGLTSVADWIGSGEFFEDPANPWRENIAQAVDNAGFTPPVYRSGLSFRQIFGFEPRPAQQQLIDQIDGPGVYVLEAPMGLGKTEAALYAAYRVLEKQQATGIYFALPTQLTSNKIYERFNEFLRGNEPVQKQGILAAECAHRSLLLHGRAWLLEMEMGEEGRPGGAWFDHAKRGLLAPFAVGTVDQALMAVMNVKHGFVRAFGLAGKVVILDEVHSYDVYTGTLLDALVDLLRSLRCIVIVLSATLNHARREQLLGMPLRSSAYPLITAVSQRGAPIEAAVPAGDHQRVAIRVLDAERPALAEALARAQSGQQVLWIENTVVDAQERYLDLAARAHESGVACGLLHSRFSADHRRLIENRCVTWFGKDGWPSRQRQGRILVGTQILEQSLDIDADFLVSRFAPTDMLLQRLGRLWRHAKTPRASSAVCEAWLLAPEWTTAVTAPLTGFGRSAHVYSPYVLCRSLDVWRSLAAIDLPGDIRDLIERTYAPRPETGAMAQWLDELDNGSRTRKGRNALAQLARLTLASDGNTLPESKAQTRYSESDGCEVLLLRSLTSCSEQKVTRLTLLDGGQVVLPWQKQVLSKRQWRDLTATLMRQIVPVHERDAPATNIDVLKKLYFQHCFYLGRDDWSDDESLLRVAVVDETGVLRGLSGEPAHQEHTLEYRDDLGYRVLKH